MVKASYEKMINEVVKSINWSRIKYFHQVFQIRWQFEEKNGHIIERFPTISELKEELKSLLRFVITKNTKTLDYGNWIIFWTNGEEDNSSNNSKLEAIFSLEECFVIDNNLDADNISILENKLEDAVKNENYEEAVILRDVIAKKKLKN